MVRHARRAPGGGLVLLVLATLSVAHALIYAITDPECAGHRLAMTQAGHDGFWCWLLQVVGVVGGALLFGAVIQLRRLARLAEASHVIATTDRSGSVRHLLWHVGRLWLRVATLTALAFLIQENLETASIGQAMPGLGAILGPHDPALLVICLVSLAVALVRALVDWRRDVLLARLRPKRPSHSDAPAVRRTPRAVMRRGLIDQRGNGVRAPPIGSALPA